MTTLAIILVVLGFLLVIAGITFSVIPGIPGPPLSGLAVLAVQLGLWWDGKDHSAGWVAGGVAVVLGLVVTAVDFAAPQLADRIRKASFGAKLGAYLGMLAAVLLSLFVSALLGAIGAGGGLLTGGIAFVVTTVLSAIAGLLLFFLVPFVGASLGELLSGREDGPDATVGDVLRGALRVGLVQAMGLVITTIAKVLFGVLAVVTCVLLLVL